MRLKQYKLKWTLATVYIAICCIRHTSLVPDNILYKYPSLLLWEHTEELLARIYISIVRTSVMPNSFKLNGKVSSTEP